MAPSINPNPGCPAPIAASDPRYSGSIPSSSFQRETPSADFGTLRHIFPRGSNDVWMAGSYGTVLHWDGTALTGAPRLTSHTLLKVWSSGPNDVWAVGESGVVIRFDGTAWKPVASGTTEPVTGVWGSGPNDIWIVSGDDSTFSKRGRILHWDGTCLRWVVNSASPFFDVYGRSAADVWAVGYYGTAMHWDGQSWTQLPRLANKDLNALWGTSSSDLWAVGDSGTALHWDGSAWSPTATNLPSDFFFGVPDVWSVSGVAANDLWALAGNSRLIRWNGSQWSSAISAPRVAYGLWHRSANELWLAGSGLYRYSSGAFAPVVAGTGPATQLWSPGTSDVWALTDQVLRRDASGRWNPVSVPTSAPIQSLWASSSSDVWIFTQSGQYFRYDGTTWSARTILLGPSRFDHTWVNSTNNGWNVDMTSNQLWRWNGSVWSQVSVGGLALGPIWGSAANDVWIAGPSSDFLRWNGSSWVSFPSGFTGATWRAIAGSSARDVWVVGSVDNGDGTRKAVAGRFDGTAWSQVPIGSYTLNSVFSLAANDAWAVGQSGTVLHWDGASWTAMESGTRNDLRRVWATSAGDVWAAGDNGLILHLKR
jgi:hypothetical protein